MHLLKSKEGQAFLDRVLNESLKYANEIGDNLKDNVYWAMKRIAEGFIESKSNRLDVTIHQLLLACRIIR